ncbi:MAG TPA: hypothetical protein VK427_00455, partial [Kofleriaceae bacterium]|nr:hypothetical protein [Kofleriaceae bacterium]
MQDALRALDYDPEFWTDTVDDVLAKAETLDDVLAVRSLVRAARILRIEAPEDPRLEAVLAKILSKDLEEPSANFMYETLLATTNRWDELEAHHRMRADRAGDHGKKIEALRTFGLEWIQRFKDRDRGAKFFDAAIKATASNGAAMRSVVAAFTLLRQVQGDRGEWTPLLDMAEQVLPRLTGEDKLYVAIQAGQIAFDKANDIARARRFFAAAASIESQNPSVQDFVAAVGLDNEVTAAGSMPMPAMTAADDVVVADDGARERDVADQLAAQRAQQAEQEAAAARARSEAEAQARDAAERAAATAAAEVMPVAETQPTGRAHVDATPATPTRAKTPTAQPVAAPPAAPAAPATLEEAMDRARAGEGNPDKGIPAWKDIIAKNPSERAPRRELARVLRAHASWAQLADALKDEEQKATTSSTDKAELFLELAETYSKLNNDNQVIAALSSALQQDGQRLEIYDRLGAIYEAKKRWPDLVKVLSEKAERTEGTPGKVAIYLQVANLYLERFSNQAEAIKAFERVLELDPHNQEAINHLLAVYEKRRDWEKLIKLKEAEVERTDPSERAAKVIEVAKMAATKVKKPEITTYWWEKVLEVEPTHDEALAELSKLYER